MQTHPSLMTGVPPAVGTREALRALDSSPATWRNGERPDQFHRSIIDRSIINEVRRQAKAVWSSKTVH